MKTNFLIGSVAFVLLVASANVGAYHLTCVPTALGTSACTWENPASGLVLVICESDGPADPVNDAPESHEGIGGLCYAGSGYSSNSAPPVTLWGEVQPKGGTGAWFARVGSNAHSCVGHFSMASADEFQYVELLAYWNGGHVEFHADQPLTDGWYVGTTGLSDPGSGYCNSYQTVAVV